METWKYQGEDFTRDKIDGHYGFIYLITNLISGRKYIGRKYFIRKNGNKWQESDWQDYCGSSEDLINDIKLLGIENFSREILKLCLTRGSTNYHELEEQFLRDVLGKIDENGNREYYNSNIASRYFVSTRLNSSEKVTLHKKKNTNLLNGKVIKKKKKRV